MASIFNLKAQVFYDNETRNYLKMPPLANTMKVHNHSHIPWGLKARCYGQQSFLYIKRTKWIKM